MSLLSPTGSLGRETPPPKTVQYSSHNEPGKSVNFHATFKFQDFLEPDLQCQDLHSNPGKGISLRLSLNWIPFSMELPRFRALSSFKWKEWTPVASAGAYGGVGGTRGVGTAMAVRFLRTRLCAVDFRFILHGASGAPCFRSSELQSLSDSEKANRATSVWHYQREHAMRQESTRPLFENVFKFSPDLIHAVFKPKKGSKMNTTT